MATSEEGIDTDPGGDWNLNALLGLLGTSADPTAILMSQLQMQAQNNPQLAQIMQILEQRRLQQIQEAAQEAEEHAAAGSEHAERQDVHDLLEDAYAELETLRLRNDALAAALGACYLCFGNDPGCNECHGGGAPGSRRPEPAAFRQFVLPALVRIKTIEEQRGGRSPPLRHQEHCNRPEAAPGS